jgi:hypothetical protein
VTEGFIDTIFTIFHKDLCLTKKSARCVPQLLTKEKKNERVRIRKECFPYHSYSPDFSPADFFLFPEVKQHHLANVTLTLDTFREAPGNGPSEPSPLMSSPPPTADSLSKTEIVR